MNAYYIDLSPRSGVKIGFISLGDNENHALANLSNSFRKAIKICTAHINGNDCVNIWQRKKDRNIELLLTIRKPGRFAKQSSFYTVPDSWPKVTIKNITYPITAAYVNEVWLG